MTPGELREYLAVLRASGVRIAKVSVGDPLPNGQMMGAVTRDVLVVEFEPPGNVLADPPAVGPEPLFVDGTGKPVNLDEGNPHLDSDQRILAANFPATDPTKAA